MDSANEACETAATEAAAEASADTAAAVRVRTSVLFGEDTKNRDGSVVMIGNDAWVASIPAEDEDENAEEHVDHVGFADDVNTSCAPELTMDDEHVAFDDNVKQSDGTSLQRKQTGPTGEVLTVQEDDDKEPEEDAAEGVEVADMNADIGKQSTPAPKKGAAALLAAKRSGELAAVVDTMPDLDATPVDATP